MTPLVKTFLNACPFSQSFHKPPMFSENGPAENLLAEFELV